MKIDVIRWSSGQDIYALANLSDFTRQVTGPYFVHRNENWCPLWRKNLMFYTFWVCFYMKVQSNWFNGAPTKLELLAIEKLKEM